MAATEAESKLFTSAVIENTETLLVSHYELVEHDRCTLQGLALLQLKRELLVNPKFQFGELFVYLLQKRFAVLLNQIHGPNFSSNVFSKTPNPEIAKMERAVGNYPQFIMTRLKYRHNRNYMIVGVEYNTGQFRNEMFLDGEITLSYHGKLKFRILKQWLPGYSHFIVNTFENIHIILYDPFQQKPNQYF